MTTLDESVPIVTHEENYVTPGKPRSVEDLQAPVATGNAAHDNVQKILYNQKKAAIEAEAKAHAARETLLLAQQEEFMAKQNAARRAEEERIASARKAVEDAQILREIEIAERKK